MSIDLRQTMKGAVYDIDADIVDAVTEDGTFFRSQDVSDVLADCAAARSEDRFRGFRKPETFHRVASIPQAVIDIYHARGIDLLKDQDALKRFLVDPENAAFRTTTERL